MTTIILAAVSDGLHGTAQFSDDMAYRYRLTRSPAGIVPKNTVCWVMLNPSTADQVLLDPTLRRCWGFTKAWGYERMSVVNLFGLRSSSPRILETHADPVGSDNHGIVLATCDEADRVVLAWGSNRMSKRTDRIDLVDDLLRHCRRNPIVLGFNDDDSPRHPLYVPGCVDPMEYRSMRTVKP